MFDGAHRRLVHFCHVHGSIHALPRRPRRLGVLAAFAAGVAVTLAVLAFLLTRI